MSDRDKRPSKYEWKTCPTCEERKLIRKEGTYCSIRCGKLGKPRHNIRGVPRKEIVGIKALHYRVVAARGRAKEHVCIGCGHPAYDWANLTGHYEDIDDYMALCRVCHQTYDYNRNRRKRECA